MPTPRTHLKEWILHDLAQVEHLRWAVKHEELLQKSVLDVQYTPASESPLGKETYVLKSYGSRQAVERLAIYVAAFFAGIHHEVDRMKKAAK